MIPLRRQNAAFVFGGFGLTIALLWALWQTAYPPLAAQCGPNPIVCENSQTGSPSSEWDITGSGDSTLQGFATDISVNIGQTVHFKVKTTAATFGIDIYRLGYYGGLGARKIASLSNNAGVNQPACLTDAATGLVDCGNWTESASWVVPANAVSGIYIAKLKRFDTGGASHIVFVVRDDDGRSDLLFQTSDTTWQAYNDYGGNSLYVGAPAGRAYKVSYNRPFNTRGNQYSRVFLFGPDYPMVRWLEANGYNVSYSTGVDSDRRGAELLEHKAFMSQGHDEYWSGSQRANVEAARAAGVHLAFFSGNQMFWKTRWENSIDGMSTPYRTLVSYKETHANAKIDPLPNVWTGTWRDPRFSPPADGGRPENTLMGPIFMVNCCQQQAIGVSGAVRQFRFWRNTLVAQLTPTQTASIAPGVVGYEFDEDVDNGFRPPGLVRLSSTTAVVPSRLLDYGSTYAQGTATHSLTIYRHSSGALVFGAGTIRWAWGLDVTHDSDSSTPNVPTTPDVTLQQATINILADMGAQPGTLQPGLVPASPNTDLAPPASMITLPANGQNFPVGTTLTITGTAADSGGGVVAAVEVSVDGGNTWHPATGRENWTFDWIPAILGPTTIMSRAMDDSGNRELPSSSVTVTIFQASCPCTIWSAASMPSQISTDTGAVELGVKFRADIGGNITGVRFYKGTTNTGTHVGNLWSATGTRLATATFSNETASGWQQVTFGTPVTVTANTTYVASYHTNVGSYGIDTGYFTSAGVDNPPLHALANGVSANGVYLYGGASAFPTQTFNAANYWVDVVFGTGAPDTTPPTATSVAPANGATGVGTATSAAATFSEGMNASTITTSTFVLRNPSNAIVASTVSYNADTNVATLVPTQPLAASTTYTATITGGAGGVSDLAGNVLASSYVWSFTTGAGPTCPCTIWNASATPAQIANDPSAVELGVRFRADTNGSITGVRFYKGATNTGPHIGTLWTNSGTLLATATFASETTSGWQQVNFTTPVAIAANTTYVVSYHTNTGNYGVNGAYFVSAGVDNAPLHALATGVDGVNGVYVYGASAFPTQTFNAANYWVDVVFGTGAPDTTPPTVTNVAPANGATGVGTATSATATFSEGMNASTITTSTFVLRNPSNAIVASTVSYNAGTSVATLMPTQPLAASTTYTATLAGGVGGVTDLAGNVLASNYVWSFTTGAGPACPCTIWNASATPAQIATSDSNAVELGVRFRVDTNGTIAGVRFYKGATNTGPHIGTLWTNSGTLLATATFASETASGWQQVNFTTPVAITANTTYVVSYHTNTGNYGVNGAYFVSAGVDNAPLHALATGVDGVNGVYVYGASAFPTQTFNAANYWVDVVFNTGAPDTTPPTVTNVAPANGATGVGTATSATATFSEGMNASTITTSTFVLRNPSNAIVASTVSYNAGTSVATLMPTQPLAASTTYTATLAGGVGGVTDLAGNVLASNYVWSFTTGAGPACPCTIWSASATPAQIETSDSNAVELGVRFRADTSGTITGVRFYKSATNTGTHVGNLWTNAGTLLATATFTSETASGWQQVTFSTPVTITANTTYVVSYHTNTGNYGVNGAYFASAGVDNAPLHALASGVDGANGVYVYGASAFPTQTYNAANYWVDVVFSTGPPDTTPPTVTSVAPANAATGVGTSTNATATFSEGMNGSTITTSTFVLRNPSNVVVASTVSYNAGTSVATLAPTQPLAASTTYTATITGGSGGVKDLAGNALASNYVWSFTTGAGPACPCTIWSASATPAQIETSDSNAVELGVRFRADTSGTITGVRFYKGATNTGTHVGNLWTNAGTLLATATFTSETASGWQQVTFSTPVTITANTTYVVSYHTNTGNYGVNGAYFASAGVDNAPLHALATGVDGVNGVYVYGASAFPTQTFNAANYWVDVVFAP